MHIGDKAQTVVKRELLTAWCSSQSIDFKKNKVWRISGNKFRDRTKNLFDARRCGASTHSARKIQSALRHANFLVFRFFMTNIDLTSTDSWCKHRYAQREWPARFGWTREPDRINASEWHTEAFRDQYEATNTPVLIRGLTDTWPAKSRWQLDALVENYGDVYFKVGESDSGSSVRLKVLEFSRYR
jgi:hypothetical protein